MTLTRKKPVPSIEEFLRNQILLVDGAMGTQLQDRNPTLEDFGSNALDGCNELLCVTRPQWIREIHQAYFDAGADAVETNSFGSNEIVLSEFGIPERSYELNKLSAQLAREVADSYDRPTYVFGSIGPGTKIVTLGHVQYDTMLKSYRTQMDGLIDGGADLLLIETSQDIQQVKIAIRAALESMQARKKRVPIIAQVTVELTGTLLVGTEISAAISALEMFPILAMGLNCATGPDEMRAHLQTLSETAPFMLSCLPNAGLPENVRGTTVYPLGPELFAEKVAALTKEFGLNIVGGCCGTTPAHIRALAKALDRNPRPRKPIYDNSVASLYTAVPLSLEPKPLYVGERTNANGSKLFRDMLGKDNFDGLVSIAKGQLKEGAHLLDVCTAYVSRNEERDMSELLQRVVTQVNIPIVIDSTETNVIEAALKLVPGKAVVNSINLEDGEDKARKVLGLCKIYGAAVIALTIDEEGMAKTVAQKLAIAQRIYAIAHDEFGLKPEDIIFDPLTFTLGAGDEEFRKSAIETLKAIRAIKSAMPGVKTILGLSNVSFGLDPYPRRLINSVMLFHAVEEGLDLAIANAGKILPLHRMEAEDRQLIEDLIYDRRKPGYDPLKEIMARFAERKSGPGDKSANEKAAMPVPDRLAHHIIDGEKLEIIATLQEALKEYKPLQIINDFLLAGMKVVGERFGAGEMQLPFVLESAEAMKTAVAYLEPFMDKEDTANKKGKILLATVKGDVHDIGKNLVDIILTNNGYDVKNLGIKQPIEQVLEANKGYNADAIGLSGLLVKSTAIMRTDLQEMEHRKLGIPVILGGAALTRAYVETDCQAAYSGKVFYAEDAFEGLRIMGRITGHGGSSAETDKKASAKPQGSAAADAAPKRPGIRSIVRHQEATPLDAHGQSTWIKRSTHIPTPPFWGSKEIAATPADLYTFLDEFALMRSRWQMTKGPSDDAELSRLLDQKARPILNTWKARCEREKLLEPRAIYGYFACNSQGDDLIVYSGPQSKEEFVRFHFPRQKSVKRLCISDFYNPVESGQRDVLALQIVTMGKVAADFSANLYAKNLYSDYFYFHGFSTELAESFAEYLHARIRKELGIHKNDARQKRKLFSQGYQGSRFSFGYPACPNLEDHVQLFKCLQPERIGVSLTESMQMVPEQSTCALIAWHPQARYFSV